MGVDEPKSHMELPRRLAMLVACGCFLVAFFGAVLLRHVGLSVLATDSIQLLCLAVGALLVVREIRIQLASERAANAPQSRTAKIGFVVAGAVALTVCVMLILGNR